MGAHVVFRGGDARQEHSPHISPVVVVVVFGALIIASRELDYGRAMHVNKQQCSYSAETFWGCENKQRYNITSLHLEQRRPRTFALGRAFVAPEVCGCNSAGGLGGLRGV